MNSTQPTSKGSFFRLFVCFKMLFILALFSVSIAFASSSSQQKKTFREAIELAIEKSPTLSSSRIQIDIRDLEYSNSISSFLPSLDLSTNHVWRDSRPSAVSDVYGRDLNLQITENLYDNGISYTKFQSAKIQRDIAELVFKDERDKIVLSVASEYMNYSLAKNLAAVQEQQFNIINKQFQSVASQYRQGVKTRRDYLRFKTELRRSEIDLHTSQTTAEKSRVELMRLMGFEMNDQIQPFDFVPIEIKLDSVAVVPSNAPDIASHYQYRIATLKREVYENDVYIVKRAYWPELFVTAGATYHRGDNLPNDEGFSENEATSWNVLMTIKFNLWDWGIRRRNVSIAQLKKTEVENTLATDLNTFSSENRKLQLDLQQSSKNFSLARELLDLETANYNSLESEYRNGRVSYLDLIVALRDFLNSKVQMYSSYYSLRIQLLKYQYHQGKIYESISD